MGAHCSILPINRQNSTLPRLVQRVRTGAARRATGAFLALPGRTHEYGSYGPIWAGVGLRYVVGSAGSNGSAGRPCATNSLYAACASDAYAFRAASGVDAYALCAASTFMVRRGRFKGVVFASAPVAVLTTRVADDFRKP